MHLVNGKQFFTNLDLRELCLARCAIISSIIPIIGTNLYSRNVVILRQSDTHNAHQLVHLQTTVYFSTTTYIEGRVCIEKRLLILDMLFHVIVVLHYNSFHIIIHHTCRTLLELLKLSIDYNVKITA